MRKYFKKRKNCDYIHPKSGVNTEGVKMAGDIKHNSKDFHQDT